MNQRHFIRRAGSILKDNNGVRHTPHQLHGTGIDIAHIAMADAGERRIFTKAERRKYADYHFMLLVDVSGSMSDDRERTCYPAVHALYHALTSAGATVQGRFFNGVTGEIPQSMLANPERLFEFLSGYVHGKGHECNHDGYALTEASKALLRSSRSQANVLVVFSDGQPACAGCEELGADCSRSRQCKTLENAIASIRKAGRMTLLGVGIQSSYCQSFYGERSTITVNQLHELYPQTCKLLEQNLRRG